MVQCLQQAESAPIGQGFMAAARSNAVSTPSFWAFLSICVCGGLANRPVRNVGFLHSSAFILLLTFHEDFLLSFQSDMAAYKSDDG
jgi:hypothetical protein